MNLAFLELIKAHGLPVKVMKAKVLIGFLVPSELEVWILSLGAQDLEIFWGFIFIPGFKIYQQ